MTVDLRRWGVFNLVGFGGFLLQIALLAVLTRGLGWPAAAATAVALEAAATLNFFGHSRWTWRDAPPISWHGWLSRYGRYQLTKSGGLAANLALTVLLIHEGLPGEIANAGAVIVCAIPNYLMCGRFVFRHGV